MEPADCSQGLHYFAFVLDGKSKNVGIKFLLLIAHMDDDALLWDPNK